MMEASLFLLREIVSLLHSAKRPLICPSQYDKIDIIGIQIFQIETVSSLYIQTEWNRVCCTQCELKLSVPSVIIEWLIACYLLKIIWSRHTQQSYISLPSMSPSPLQQLSFVCGSDD